MPSLGEIRAEECVVVVLSCRNSPAITQQSMTWHEGVIKKSVVTLAYYPTPRPASKEYIENNNLIVSSLKHTSSSKQTRSTRMKD